MYKRAPFRILAVTFAFCLGFATVGVRWTAAQAAPREPVSPKLPSTVIGQPSPTASPEVSSEVRPKPRVIQAARPAVPAPNKGAKEPEEMKIVRIYRGEGHFDAALAEKLRPELSKAFDVKPADGQPVITNMVRSMLGQGEAETNANKNKVTNNTGQP